jgi:NADP-dependent 3-hydroxy acid dehydrogenase YdfG
MAPGNDIKLDRESVAIVTGASSGIGLATVKALAERGARIAMLARSLDKLTRTAAAIRNRGGDALEIACDVRNEAAVNDAVAQVLDRFNRIDILVNSAGLSLNGEVDGYPTSDWKTVIDTNLTGTFFTCRAVLPAMKRQGAGQIVNISSGAGRNGIANMSAYCASKFGVIGFTEALALEVRRSNIRVSVLAPGSVATRFSQVAKRSAEEQEIGYAMTAEEVAGVIVSMLAQPDQAWMSEVVLRPLNLDLRRTIKV